MKKYLIYHLRWQSGFIISIPCMYFFKDYLELPSWLVVLIFQFIGALIFYPIDKYIFNKKK